MDNIQFIDVHHHILPQVYRDGLKEEGIEKSGGKPFRNWVPEDSLELMERQGIATAICSISEPAVYPVCDISIPKARDLARKTNESMAEMMQKYPGKFGAFAVLPLPDVEGALEEMEYALDVLKLDGVGFVSNYHDDYLGNNVFDEIFAEMQKRKAAGYVHPSVPPKNFVRPQYTPLDYFEEFTFCTTRAASNLILSGTMERCPDIKLFFSHMGGTFPYLRWRLTACHAATLENPNLPLTPEHRKAYESLTKPVSEYMSMYYYDTALASHDIAYHALEQINPNHVCYGSDAFFATPWLSEYGKEGLLREYGNDREKYYAIARGNAEKVFPRFANKSQSFFPMTEGFVK